MTITTAPPYGPPLGLATAQRIMTAAETEARRHGASVSIAIVDAAGHLVMLQKLDDAQHSSVDVAIGKARTAVNFRRPTKYYEDAIAAGGAGLRFLAMPGMTPFEGGVPIMVHDAIVGGIGVSGVRSDMDAQIAAAGEAQARSSD
ncbi:MAG: heme-binding protein [Pseudomonadota bacterium]|nr:heme-binding protein [Pseudomonadota bacterium]